MTNQVPNHDQEIGSQLVDDIWNLALMLGIPEETLETIFDETPGVDNEFENNLVDKIIEVIADKLIEMGFDDEDYSETAYDNIFWDILRKRFNEKIEKENIQIQASKANYKRMLDDLRKPLPTLRPLPDDAKPYPQILFENQNQELLEYFKNTS
ncbi:hypothetical protein M9Y10_014181 [Tritrichomonas musculus]|uniref:Uncharacterized protein n=1 Tax=Tritrichomonas musculus TaxID=1915356 RepID=A0ABR2KYW0_9EUKA